ncbi:hypothetical protein OSTOST_05802, partial [Ostertagia ostertagi]
MLFALVALTILLVSVDARGVEKRNSPAGEKCLSPEALKKVIVDLFTNIYGSYFDWNSKMASDAQRMIDRGVESPYTGVFYTKSFDNKTAPRTMEEKVRRTLEKSPLSQQPHKLVSFGCDCEH